MILRVRLFDIKRRRPLGIYIDDVYETLRILQSFAPNAIDAWKVPGRPPKHIVIEPATLLAHAEQSRIRNRIGEVFEEMGYSFSLFLDSGNNDDIHASFHLGIESERTPETVRALISAKLIVGNWEGLIEGFRTLISMWQPQCADVWNSEAFVDAEDLAGQVPVGFACYLRSQSAVPPPAGVHVEHAAAGILAYLNSPRFDASREEADSLATLGDYAMRIAQCKTKDTGT